MANLKLKREVLTEEDGARYHFEKSARESSRHTVRIYMRRGQDKSSAAPLLI